MSHDHRPSLEASRVTLPEGHRWNRLGFIFGAIGVIGIGASASQAGSNPKQFAFSWLVAFIFCLSIALGALFFVLLHHLANARWSVVVRRTAEHVAGSLWVFLPLFAVVYLGRHELFHWMDAEHVAHDALLQGKTWYLNEGFFLLRAGLLFTFWIGTSMWFAARSRAQDTSGDPMISHRLRQLSAPGMLLFAITLSVAAIDWVMSLDPHWYSTIFGVYIFAGSLVGVFAFLSIFTVAARRAKVATDVITVEHQHDLGKLLFAFTVFWAYIAFSQYFLIWYGNIPEETLFYEHRMHGSWMNVTLLLAVGHFVIPFFFLMSRHVKRRGFTLVLASLWMLLMHLIDMHWLIMPTLHKEGFDLHLLDLTTLVGVAGIVLGWFFFSLRGRALVPLRDPRLAESLGFENL